MNHPQQIGWRGPEDPDHDAEATAKVAAYVRELEAENARLTMRDLAFDALCVHARELEAENARLKAVVECAGALAAHARELEAKNAAVKELVKLMDASLTSALTTIRVLGAENARLRTALDVALSRAPRAAARRADVHTLEAENARLKAIVAGTVSRGSCKAARELTEHMTLVDAHVTAAVIACALLEAADHALAQQRFSDTRAAIEESWRGPREHAAREHTALVDLVVALDCSTSGALVRALAAARALVLP